MDSEKSYKHILWVEDFDTKNTSTDNMPKGDEWDSDESIPANHTRDILNNFGEEYVESVKLIIDILGALNFVDAFLSKIDCVILDINLRHSLGNNQSEIKEKLKNRGVLYNENYDIGENGGYYIYLYLLKSGFPSERICVYTGNKGELNLTGDWERIFTSSCLSYPNSIGKDKPKELQEWIKHQYDDKYYRARRLVFKACEFWISNLREISREEIAFNRVYYQDNKKTSIEPVAFINMLKRIEMFYPIMPPQNQCEMYYQMLQVATAFHEESANISTITEDSVMRRYHQAARSYRNWSAHNRFEKNEIEADIFVYLFCVTLRSYFQDKKEQFIIDIAVEPGDICYNNYEREYFEKLLKDKLPSIDFVKKRYSTDFNRHIRKIRSLTSSNSSNVPEIHSYKSMKDLLLNSGMKNTSESNDKMLISDLLLFVIDEYISHIKYPEESRDFLEYKVNYQWKKKNDNDVQRSLNSCKGDYLKYLAYILYEDDYQE